MKSEFVSVSAYKAHFVKAYKAYLVKSTRAASEYTCILLDPL